MNGYPIPPPKRQESGGRQAFLKKGAAVSLTAALLALGVFLAYVVFNFRMNPQGIYLRTWAVLTAKTFGMLLFPTALFLCLLFLLLYGRKKFEGKGDRAFAVLAAVGGTLYGLYTAAALGYMALTFMTCEGEARAPDGWLAGGGSLYAPMNPYDVSPRTQRTDRYYEEYNWLWKKEYKPTAASVSREMGRRLGREVEPAAENMGTEGFVRYTLTASGPQSVTFHVLPDAERNFENDYAQAYANTLMAEYLAGQAPDREASPIFEYGGEKGGWIRGMSLSCRGRGDMEEISRLAAGMVEEVLQDTYFDRESASFSVYCEDVREFVAPVTFSLGAGDAAYTDWSLIYARLLDNYTWNGKAGEEGETPEEPDYEDSAFYVEGAYRALYEELFEGRGYPYKPSYDAKGNFYAYLTEGTATQEGTGDAFDTAERVVYDRKSANGKCHLFVRYMDYYEVGTVSPFATSILDMYAVDMETGAVYASGRRAWSDLGNEAYREATGEP